MRGGESSESSLTLVLTSEFDTFVEFRWERDTPNLHPFQRGKSYLETKEEKLEDPDVGGTGGPDH